MRPVIDRNLIHLGRPTLAGRPFLRRALLWRFATASVSSTFADFFLPVLTRSRLCRSASIRLTTFGGVSSVGRHDLLAGDLGVDDPLQLFLVLVAVLLPVQLPFEVLDHLLRELDLFRLDLRRDGLQLVDASMLRTSLAWRSVYITSPLSFGSTATRYSRP